MISRRGILAMAAAAPFVGGAAARAAPPPSDLGVQLWMVRQSMARDLGATLRALSDLSLIHI